MGKKMSIATAEVICDLCSGWLDGFGSDDAETIWPERTNEDNAKRQTFRRLLKTNLVQSTGYETIRGNPIYTLTNEARQTANTVASESGRW
jgi:hypothetical protein